jgi:CcmD family protein
MKAALAVMLLMFVALGSVAAQAPPASAPAKTSPPTAAAQDGFVPVDAPINAQDTMPAPRLVAAAYAFIWLVFFGYLASLKMRLSTVEREIQAVSRRVGTRGGAA